MTNGSNRESPLFRTYYLLRYHKVRQLARRLVKIVRHKLGGGLVADGTTLSPAESCRLPAACSDLLALRRHESSADAAAILRGDFTFLNDHESLGWPVDWQRAAHQDALWEFHLHYHEFLLALIDDDGSGIDRVWEGVVDWIEHYPPNMRGNASTGWHPFCISRRLPVWILIYDRHPPREKHDLILDSIHRQARHLYRNLELDLEGNHLLENMRALVFASVFLNVEERSQWLQRAAQVLRWQIPEQILAHGEHFEKSPMYHCVVFELMLDLADLTSEIRGEIFELSAARIPSMANFTCALRCPDGSLPQFADAERVPASFVDDLLQRAKPYLTSTVSSLDHQGTTTIGGYWIQRHAKGTAIFDAAVAGPDHLPGHCHADLLNLELWLDGHPMIVDSGVYDYADSEMRRYCRSSSAHSVLTIDEMSQFDQWSRFRVGYRGHPSPLQNGHGHNDVWAEATHNAYRRCGFDRVGRRIGVISAQQWICVDWVSGGKQGVAASLIQLHPEVHCRRLDDDSALLEHSGDSYRLSVLGAGRLNERTGWQCPAYGVKHSRTVLAIETDLREVPTAIGWTLSPEGLGVDLSLTATPDQWRLNAGDSVLWARPYNS